MASGGAGPPGIALVVLPSVGFPQPGPTWAAGVLLITVGPSGATSSWNEGGCLGLRCVPQFARMQLCTQFFQVYKRLGMTF